MWVMVIKGLRDNRDSSADSVLAYYRVQPTPAVESGGDLPPNPRPGEPALPVGCWVIPRRQGTPEQWQALGEALCRWSKRESVETGLLHHLDHLALFNLAAEISPITGLLNPPREAIPAGPRPGGAGTARDGVEEISVGLEEDQNVFFAVRGGDSYNRQHIIDSLRRDISPELVDDILVDGKSWEILE